MVIAERAVSPAASEVKFRLIGGAQPVLVLPVAVNEQGPFEFILDTGASTSLISPELARSLHLESTGAKKGQTEPRVGGAEIRDVYVVVGDFLTMLSQAAGAKLDGIVGYNFLRNYQVVIDYPNELFRLE